MLKTLKTNEHNTVLNKYTFIHKNILLFSVVICPSIFIKSGLRLISYQQIHSNIEPVFTMLLSGAHNISVEAL